MNEQLTKYGNDGSRALTYIKFGNNGIESTVLAGLGMRLHSLIQDVENYSLHSSIERVIGFLLQLAGTPAGGPVDIELPASKHIIASRLNLTPETLSRVLHSLSESGLIRVNGKRITVLDATRLSQFDGTLRPPCATHLPQPGQRL